MTASFECPPVARRSRWPVKPAVRRCLFGLVFRRRRLGQQSKIQLLYGALLLLLLPAAALCASDPLPHGGDEKVRAGFKAIDQAFNKVRHEAGPAL